MYLYLLFILFHISSPFSTENWFISRSMFVMM